MRSERLTFRPFREDDALSAYMLWYSQPDIAKFMFWGTHHDIEETRTWLEFELAQLRQPDWFRFAVEETTTHCLIGSVLLYFEPDVSGWEIAYHFARAYWGHGYATEAVSRIALFGRDQLHLKGIIARYAKENVASGRVLEKAGFVWEKEITYVCNDGTVVLPGVQCRLPLLESL